jgi:hypothetical protein
MAEYKGIKGFKVQTVSTDPAASAIATGTWASGGDLNTARYSAITESWNGSAWTEVNDLNLARQLTVMHGTQTAALAAGGFKSTPAFQVNNVESWNGTSWTETTEINTARYKHGGSGTQTDFLIYGGLTPSITNITEFWNGTSWTEVADMATGRSIGGDSGSGSSSSALASGGSTDASSPGITTATEEWTTASSFQQENLGQVFYNSTADAFKVTKDNSGIPLGTWASGGNLNTARSSVGGAGTQTAALAFGGNPIPIALNESYNGTSWTEVNDLNTARLGTRKYYN